MKVRKGTSFRAYGGKIIKKCVICGDEFICCHPRTKYCSYRCINDAYIITRRERKNQERDKVCIVCNKEFHAKRKDAMYCCAACKQKAYRKNVTALS